MRAPATHWILSVTLLTLSASGLAAQTGFRLDSTWILEINGSSSEAEIYRAPSPAAMLVMSEQLPEPVMLLLGAGSVNGVQLMKVARQADGSINVLANPFSRSFGSYQVEGSGVTFSVDDRRVAIVPKPPLTGFHGNQDLVDHDSGYGERKQAYSPAATPLAQLAGQSAATVRVFFGSWCPACSQIVPRILAVEEALGDSAVKFEYYGLPRGFGDDAEAKRFGVNSVPTAVVLRDGQPVATVQGTELSQPEAALLQALEG